MHRRRFMGVTRFTGGRAADPLLRRSEHVSGAERSGAEREQDFKKYGGAGASRSGRSQSAQT